MVKTRVDGIGGIVDHRCEDFLFKTSISHIFPEAKVLQLHISDFDSKIILLHEFFPFKTG